MLWPRRTLPLGFAAPFAPNFSVKALSTAFFNSKAFAQRRSVAFNPPIAAPRLFQPV